MRVQAGSCLVVALCGCVEPAEDILSIDRARPCTVIDNRSLIELDSSIVSDARFSLERVFDQIRLTTPIGYAAPSARDMFAQLFGAYSACSGGGIDPHGYGIACRPPEASLVTLDPFTDDPAGLHFQPVAVLGRFDMANEHRGTCGESRIVYWKDRGPVEGKAGIIVELHTPPAIDARGHTSCQPIAEFWASLSAEDDAATRAAMLDEFFFVGLPGMPYAPASARGAGWDGPGQLRANNFVGLVQWNLRESKYRGTCSDGVCQASFVAIDTKNSPSEKLFAGTHPNAAAFEHWFISKSVPKLAKARVAAELSLGNPPDFNAYEGVSQPKDGDPTSVLYSQHASPQLRAAIAGKLVELGSKLTVDNILDRATAVTCAGCHRISRNADLGDGLVFPAPAGFVHVGEGGRLSPAIVEQFLPARRRLLQNYVCGKSFDVADDETLGGHVVDEPN